MKTATARVDLEVWANCPHCDEPQEIKEEVDEAEAWFSHRLDIPKCEVEILCENPDCEKQFLVTKANF